MIDGGLSGGRTDLEIDWWGIFVDPLIQIISNLHELATYNGYTYTVIDSWLAIWDFQYIGLVNSEDADLLYNLQAACAFLNLISVSTAVLAVIGGVGVSVGFAIGIGIAVFLIVQLLTIIRLTLYEYYFEDISFLDNKKVLCMKKILNNLRSIGYIVLLISMVCYKITERIIIFYVLAGCILLVLIIESLFFILYKEVKRFGRILTGFDAKMALLLYIFGYIIILIILIFHFLDLNISFSI